MCVQLIVVFVSTLEHLVLTFSVVSSSESIRKDNGEKIMLHKLHIKV